MKRPSTSAACLSTMILISGFPAESISWSALPTLRSNTQIHRLTSLASPTCICMAPGPLVDLAMAGDRSAWLPVGHLLLAVLGLWTPRLVGPISVPQHGAGLLITTAAGLL